MNEKGSGHSEFKVQRSEFKVHRFGVHGSVFGVNVTPNVQISAPLVPRLRCRICVFRGPFPRIPRHLFGEQSVHSSGARAEERRTTARCVSGNRRARSRKASTTSSTRRNSPRKCGYAISFAKRPRRQPAKSAKAMVVSNQVITPGT